MKSEQKQIINVFQEATPTGQKILAGRNIFEFMEENRKEVNKILPNYSQIVAIEVVEKEFEKTPKRSIKRFLYS